MQVLIDLAVPQAADLGLAGLSQLFAGGLF
jgi:hypothetical protein